MTVGALPRGEAARIVRGDVLRALPWLRMHTRQDRPLPSAVALEAVQRMVAGLLGWDALNDLCSLSVHRDAIEAEAYARDQEGRHFVVDDDIAVDRIFIRIT